MKSYESMECIHGFDRWERCERCERAGIPEGDEVVILTDKKNERRR